MMKLLLGLLFVILIGHSEKAYAIDKVVIASVPSEVHYENIFLLADTIDGDWMAHRNFTVQIGFPPGKLLYHFPHWKNEKFTPDLFYEDINLDSLKDIVVVLVSGSGSGLAMKEVHVLNQLHDSNRGYEEVPVESLNDAVKRLVKMERQDNLATILIGKNKYSVDISKFGYTFAKDEQPFVGMWEQYASVNGILEGSTLVYVSLGGVIGTLKVRYDWDGNRYFGKSITFEEAEPWPPKKAK
jgi:hypothetical protein